MGYNDKKYEDNYVAKNEIYKAGLVLIIFRMVIF